jgi:hypothetical protein
VRQLAAVAASAGHPPPVGWRRPCRRPWQRVLRLVGALVALAALPACEGPGSTTDIAEAEAEIVAAVEAVADGLGLDQRRERPLGTRSRCTWVAGRPGARNSVAIVGVPTISGDPLDRGAQLILEAGFELVDSGVPDTVFGRREGMRLTVVRGPDGEVSVDGATDCKPLPGR